MNEGKKDRRDPIRTVKPRNFVAKNASATTSGAGAHKDKKKAMKQGDVKHKKQEYAEGLQNMLETALRDKEDYTEKRKALDTLSRNKDVDQKVVQQRRLDLDKEAKKKGIAEDFDNPEYDDEAGMSHGSLYTIQRAAEGLLDVIQQGDDLPEWCQEKISLAEDYLVTVWDYLQSEKAQGVDPEIGESGLQYYTGKKKYGKNGMTALAAAGRKGASQEELGRIKDKYIKKEGWTHDTLAAQLFETENTYEEKLNNALNRKLGK